MPSKKKNRGNPVVVLRLTPELLARIDDAVARSQATRFESGYDRSSFIRACIEERFAKYGRAKKSNAQKRTAKAAAEADSVSGFVSDLSPEVEAARAAFLAQHGLIAAVRSNSEPL